MTLPPGWRVLPASEAGAAGHGLEPITLRHPDPPLCLVRDLTPSWPVGWYALTLRYDGPGMVDARVVLGMADGTQLPQHFARTGRNVFSGLFRPTKPLASVVVMVSGSAALDEPASIDLRAVPRWEQRRALLRRGLAVLRGDPRSFPWRAARFFVQWQRQGRTTIPLTTDVRSPEAAYGLWRERFDERPEQEADLHAARAERLVRRPLFTVVAGPDVGADAAAALRDSLLAQHHAAWELLVPVGALGGREAPGDDPRVRTYAGPGAALDLARGDFALLPRPGTVLRPHALTVLAAALDRFTDAELVYADEDRLEAGHESGAGRRDPAFKPAWSPQRLLATNYLGDPCAIAMPLLRRAGLDGAFAPAGRHGLMLRVTEGLAPCAIVHVAQVLSHASGAVPEAAAEERKAAIREALARRGVEARVMSDPRSPHPRIGYVADDQPLVSLIVPTRDRAAMLRTAVNSIRAKTAYGSYEILVVDNGSVEDDTFKLFESWVGDGRVRVIRDDGSFNYPRLNNRAAAEARGALLGLVNNDVEVRDGSWLDEMVGLALQPGVGCVGAKLWYPDGRLQHGGVVVGVAGAAGHRHKRAARGARGQLDALATVNEVSAVTAACLVVKKSVYDEVGGMDEARFAVAYNDVDLCLKVAESGYRNLWTPFAELVHHESVSRGRDLGPRTAKRFSLETEQLKLRWGHRLLDDPYYSPNLTLDAEDGGVRVQ